MQELFNRLDPVNKENNRGNIKNLPSVGKQIYFFGLKGSEPALIFIPPVLIILFVPSSFYIVILISLLVWSSLAFIRSTTKSYRNTQFLYWAFSPKKGILLTPQKEVVKAPHV